MPKRSPADMVDPALSLTDAGAFPGPRIIEQVEQKPFVKAYKAMFTNLNQVPLNSHSGETLGSSDAIKINDTQNTNLASVNTHSFSPLISTNIGEYLPIVSNRLKNNNSKVVNTGYEMPLNIHYLASVASATCESTPKVIK